MCGGGGGASSGEVQAIVDDAVDPLVDAGTQLNATMGTASETGTTTAGGGTFTTPVTNQLNADGEIVQVGGETVNYGGGEVAVTDTVKGDTEKIIGGQADTNDLINKRFDTFQPTTVVNQTIDTSDLAKQADLTSGFATSEANQEAILKDTGAMQLTLADMGTDIDTGFASVGTELGKANTGIGELKTGQTGLADDISDLSGANTKRFDTIDDTLDTGFSGVNENINTQFNTQNQNLTDMSANILGGQTSLQEYLEGMSGRADTYYGGLAEGQSNLQNDLSGLQSGFTDFRDAYDTNTTLANQTRAELMDTVSGGFNNMRGAIADNFQDTRSDINQVSAQVDNVQNRQANLTQTQTQDFTSTLRDLASGLEASTQDQAAAQNDVMSRLDTVKQVLATQGENLPDQVRQEYTALAQSFDENGRLIRESVDEQGVITRRAMDDQSNVLMAQFNQQGNMIGQSMINVSSLLKQMDNFGYTGTGAQPGSLAPQQLVSRRAAIESGLMERKDPHFNTFG